MRLLPKPVSPDVTFNEDLLGREKFSASLTNIITQFEDSFVLALDGDWGTGKSTFLHMWKNSLTGKGIPAIYFDAFACDHFDDPLIPLVGEIGLKVRELHGDQEEAGQLIAIAGKVAVGAVKRILKLIGQGVLKEVKLDLVAGAVSAAISDATVSPMKETIQEYEEGKKVFEDFRITLQSAAKHLSERQGAGQSDVEQGKRPLVLIIDELDRCRPDFALLVLERAKHLLSVPGVQIVLGVNRTQLGAIISTRYGSEKEAGGYLDKFLNLNIPLPSISESPSVLALEKYVTSQLDDLPPSTAKDLRVSIRAYMIGVACRRGLSLRQIERVVALIKCVIAINGTKFHNIFTPFVVSLCVIRQCNPDVYRLALAGGISDKRILECLVETKPGIVSRSGHTASEDFSKDIEHLCNGWIYCLDASRRTAPDATFRPYMSEYMSYGGHNIWREALALVEGAPVPLVD